MTRLFFFDISSMKEDTSAQLSGRGELHGKLGLYYIYIYYNPSYVEKVYLKPQKSDEKYLS